MTDVVTISEVVVLKDLESLSKLRLKRRIWDNLGRFLLGTSAVVSIHCTSFFVPCVVHCTYYISIRSWLSASEKSWYVMFYNYNRQKYQKTLVFPNAKLFVESAVSKFWRAANKKNKRSWNFKFPETIDQFSGALQDEFLGAKYFRMTKQVSMFLKLVVLQKTIAKTFYGTTIFQAC